MKKKIYFIIMAILLIIFGCIFRNNNMDDIWNYGFSYNIAKGAIPYKDFNMVVMPFYSLLMALPLKIFSNTLITFHVSNAILVSLILYFTSSEKKLGNFFLISICLIGYASLSNYSTFIGMLLILVLYLENSNYKYKNEVIGLLLGFILTTKQNMGIVLFIPYILHSKQKLKSIIWYLLPLIGIVIYLLINNALYECIDYCFLGLGNFANNFMVSPIIIMELIICILLVLKYKKTKDINYLYLLFFQFINFPLFELLHFIFGIVPIIYYVNLNNKYLSMFLYGTILGCFCLLFVSKLITNQYYIKIQKNGVYKYTNADTAYDDIVAKFINKNKDKRVFIFNSYAYTVKIYMNQKLDKFDLINKGNMGSDEYKYIDDLEKICSKKECVFIMNKKEFDIEDRQVNPIIRDYVLDNYEKCGSYPFSYYCKKNTE